MAMENKVSQKDDKSELRKKLEQEIKDLRVVAIETYGVGSMESTLAGLAAVRAYEQRPKSEKIPLTYGA